MWRGACTTAILLLIFASLAQGFGGGTDWIVDGQLAGRTEPLLWQGRAVGAFVCKAKTTSLPAPSPTPIPGGGGALPVYFNLDTAPSGIFADFIPDGMELTKLKCEPIFARLSKPVLTPTPAPTPRPTSTRTPVPARTCPACAPGWTCSQQDCDAFGDCACRPKPTPTVAPTRTPAPVATPAGTLLPLWWPTDQQRNLTQAFGSWPGTDHAIEEFWFCNPDQLDDQTVSTAVKMRRTLVDTGQMPEAKRPRCWVGETWTYGWCLDVQRAGGWRTRNANGTVRAKTPAELPETLSSGGTTPAAITKRITDGVAWGVKPLDWATAPYIFTLFNRDGFAAFKSLFPSLFPAGYQPARGAPAMDGQGGAMDYPDTITVKAAVACLEQWLYALHGQHPEIGTVVVQLSNGGEAFGFGGAGYDLPALVAQVEARAGYPKAEQLEAFDCPTYPCTGSNWVPRADCAMYCPAKKAGATVSVFAGDLYAPIASQLDACVCP